MTRRELAGPAHHRWDPTLPPTLTVDSGDELRFDLTEASDGQFAPGTTVDAIGTFDWSRLYPMLGPVAVHDAGPGDVLEIEVLELESGSWGWSAVLPELGLLAEDFPEPHLHHWTLTGGPFTSFLDVARVPVRPFCGVMGVCPAVEEPRDVMPPGHFGGNLDCRDLVAGARLYLPVQLPGALFSTSDPHAAQGDGEVCVSAIEAPLRGAFRVRLHHGRTIRAPQLETPGPLRRGIDDEGYFATMGVGPDLKAAARDAVRALIEHVGRLLRIEPVEAYVLASVAADLKITEVVDAPNWVVSAYLPRSILRAG